MNDAGQVEQPTDSQLKLHTPMASSAAVIAQDEQVEQRVAEFAGRAWTCDWTNFLIVIRAILQDGIAIGVARTVAEIQANLPPLDVLTDWSGEYVNVSLPTEWCVRIRNGDTP